VGFKFQSPAATVGLQGHGEVGEVGAARERLVLIPVTEEAQERLNAVLLGPGELFLPDLGDLQQLGPAVRGVLRPGDEAAFLEFCEVAAQHGGTHAEPLRDVHRTPTVFGDHVEHPEQGRAGSRCQGVVREAAQCALQIHDPADECPRCCWLYRHPILL